MHIFTGKVRSGVILTSVLACVGMTSIGSLEPAGADVSDVVAFKCSFSASAPSTASLGTAPIEGFEDLGGPVAILTGDAPPVESLAVKATSSNGDCTLLKRDALVASVD